MLIIVCIITVNKYDDKLKEQNKMTGTKSGIVALKRILYIIQSQSFQRKIIRNILDRHNMHEEKNKKVSFCFIIISLISIIKKGSLKPHDISETIFI